MGGEDYEREFSPKDYLTTFYSFDSGTVAEREVVKFSLQNLYQTFSAGEWLRCPLGRGWSCANRNSSFCTGAAEGTSLAVMCAGPEEP